MDKKYDSVEQHISDTLRAGDGLCNKKIVQLVIGEGPQRISELIQWGVNFDKQKNKAFHFAMEGGHTVNRVLHYGDATGLQIEKTLLRQVHNAANITVLSHHFVVDLITEHHTVKRSPSANNITCFGAYLLSQKEKKVETALSKITLVATGGIGQVYRNTTNPLIATGDGIAMAYRAGAEIKNMEFVQFHPTALYYREESPSFLISEAVRGAGAILRTRTGKQFMYKYDVRKELASRDIVARAIDHEFKKSGDGFVYLDCRRLKQTEFIKRFPTIYQKCKSVGINVFKDMIPVVPAAHYLCGGIKTNEHGMATINNLYACGECACTGLHGANRLASNSLLEALVFAHRCYVNAVKKIEKIPFRPGISKWSAKGVIHPKEKITIRHNRRELQETMSNFAGIVRTNTLLNKAMARLKLIDDETKELYYMTKLSPELCELRNMIDVAKIIVKQSMKRKENKGVFYNIDI